MPILMDKTILATSATGPVTSVLEVNIGNLLHSEDAIGIVNCLESMQQVHS